MKEVVKVNKFCSLTRPVCTFKIYLTENLVFFIKRVANYVRQNYLNAFFMLLRIFTLGISSKETLIINKEEEK